MQIAHQALQPFLQHMRVNLRGRDVGVAEQRLHHAEVGAILQTYPAVQEVLWVQEEPWNMGAWHEMFRRMRRVVPDSSSVSTSSYAPSARLRRCQTMTGPSGL